MIKSLQTYGFLTALRVGGCSIGHFNTILQLTEAFLLRRHICRERANENKSAFASLCGIDYENPLKKVTDEFQRLSPSDEALSQAFVAFEFTPSLIDRARYCLERFELNRQGQHLDMIVGGSDIVHVEHIIPLKISTVKAKKEFGDWPTYLGKGSEAKHPHFVSRIGNLTLFAGALNIAASNNPYDSKKDAYRNSAIKLTNTLPIEYPDLAVKLWPIAKPAPKRN
jgi:hypothetical protein